MKPRDETEFSCLSLGRLSTFGSFFVLGSFFTAGFVPDAAVCFLDMPSFVAFFTAAFFFIFDSDFALALPFTPSSSGARIFDFGTTLYTGEPSISRARDPLEVIWHPLGGGPGGG